jgi:hypothetical protein
VARQHQEVLFGGHPPWRLIPSRDVARLLGVSLQVLANWRVRGSGPPFDNTIRGKGNKVFYKRSDVLAWAAGQRGERVEAWEICRDWLAERGFEMHDMGPEAIDWLATEMDSVFR